MSGIRTNIVGANLTINLVDLLESLESEDRAVVIDALACDSQIITEVANQIIDGWTTMGSHGSTGFGGNPEAVHGIDGARMRIAKASNEIAAKEIERLGEALKRSEANSNAGWAEYHTLLYNRNGRF